MTNLEGRVIRLELMLKKAEDALRAANTRLNTLETNGRQPLAMMWNQGGGGMGGVLWVLTPGTGGPATGTWGTITPDSFTADVYRTVGGAQTLVATGATIYWWYNDTFAASKPVPVGDNGDGTYDAIAEGCTAF